MKKRTLSLILSVAMVVTMVVAFVVPASAAAKIEPDAAWYQESATELVIEDAADFLAFIRQAQARSLYDTGVEVAAADRILTLITCDRSYAAADGRLIVLAVEQ